MLELMPDGETFKKLGAAQSAALERYYKREKDSLLDKTLPPLISTGIPSILAIGLAAAAYVFKDELEEETIFLTLVIPVQSAFLCLCQLLESFTIGH